MSARWIYRRNQTLINFLVSCDINLIYFKFLDASDLLKFTDALSDMYGVGVKDVGPYNVVISDNVVVCIAVGRLLRNKHSVFKPMCSTLP